MLPMLKLFSKLTKDKNIFLLFFKINLTFVRSENFVAVKEIVFSPFEVFG